MYDTLDAEWHWYRYEFQARGSIHCHGTAKLKNDPGLCKLAEIALKGFLAQKTLQESAESVEHSVNHSDNRLHDIEQGEIASQTICDYVDSLVSTCNPIQLENQSWTKPSIHPCRKKHEFIQDSDRDNDYADLVNTVQRHTRCSTKYCLRPSGKQEQKELHCRFKYPIDCCNKTTLDFEPVHTKDKSIQYKAKVSTKRNDSRLNNHQPIQLRGWRANC